MLCDECRQNPATVKLIAIVDGNRTERHLCATCMTKHKFQMRAEGIRSILTAIWSGVGKPDTRHEGLSCSKCGMNYDDFLRDSHLGCAQCYQDFRAQLKPLLVRLHGRSQHAGRVPERVDETVKTSSRIEDLRREMQIAVACEEFEQAALLRDELRALSATAKEGTANA